MAEAVVRRAEATDRDRRALARLRRRWTEEDAGAAVDDPGFERRAAEWIAANQSHRLGWLAELDGEPVGFVTAVIIERMPQPGRPDSGWGYVHHFFVAPEHRSQGIGSLLVDAVVEEGRRRGWEQLLLHPRPRSRPFYEQAGFAPVGERFVLRKLE